MRTREMRSKNGNTEVRRQGKRQDNANGCGVLGDLNT